MCVGSGSWTRMPLTAGSRVERVDQRQQSACDVVAGRSCANERMPTRRSSGACCARRPATPDCRRRARPRGPAAACPAATRAATRRATSSVRRRARALPSMMRAVMSFAARAARDSPVIFEVRGFYPNAVGGPRNAVRDRFGRTARATMLDASGRVSPRCARGSPCAGAAAAALPPAVGSSGAVAGWLDDARAARLAAMPTSSPCATTACRFVAGLDDAPARTAALDRVARALAAEGLLTAWRDERYAVAPDFGAPPWFLLERAAARYFGVHTTRRTSTASSAAATAIAMWIARRSPTKAIDPGMLDNLVGGGIAAGQSVPRPWSRKRGRKRASPRRSRRARSGGRRPHLPRAARRPAARDDLRPRPVAARRLRPGRPGRRSRRASAGAAVRGGARSSRTTTAPTSSPPTQPRHARLPAAPRRDRARCAGLRRAASAAAAAGPVAPAAA